MHDIDLVVSSVYLSVINSIVHRPQAKGETFYLASFPGSPGTQIFIAQRAWYLSYVSMTSAK